MNWRGKWTVYVLREFKTYHLLAGSQYLNVVFGRTSGREKTAGERPPASSSVIWQQLILAVHIHPPVIPPHPHPIQMLVEL